MDEEGSAAASASVVARQLRVAISQLIRRLREQTDASDLTRSQSSVLLRLEREGPATATELARAEGIRPQSMGAILAVLDEAGLTVGSPDPKDGRKINIRLTDAAQEQFRTGRLAKQDWLSRAIDTDLTPFELEQLAGAVELLVRLGRSV